MKALGLVWIALFFLFSGCATTIPPAHAVPPVASWPPSPPPLAPVIPGGQEKKVAPPPPASEPRRLPPPASRPARPVCFSRAEIAAILRAKQRLSEWPERCNRALKNERLRQEALCKRERDELASLLKDCHQKKQPVCGTLCWIGIGGGVLVGIGIGVGVTILLERTRR